jgi:DNA-binding NarL/FixJ family response regulator
MSIDEQRSATSMTRLFLIVENRIMREALSGVFRRQSGFSLIATVPSASAHELINASDYDVLIVERASALVLPSSFVSDLLSHRPAAKVVLFGMKNDPHTFLQAVKSGARGYLLEEAGAKEIVAAVRKVAAGEAVSPPCLCDSLFEFVARSMPDGSMVLNQRLCYELGLTHRQQQLVALLARGLTNKEIAAALHLSEFTVKNHVRRIIRHLNAPSRYAAVQIVCARNVAAISTAR